MTGANPHLAEPLVGYGRHLDDVGTAIVLVHGRGHDPPWMEEHVARRLRLDDVAFVAPAAAGQTWYPGGFMEETERNEPWLGWTMERMSALVEDIRSRGFADQKIAFVGFSQGGCVAAEWVARHPGRYGCLCVLTGGLIGPPGSTWPLGDGALDGLPVLLATSDIDAWVPYERVEETARVLQRAGASVELHVYPGMDHVICDDEIHHVRRLLQRVVVAPSS